MRRVTPVAVVAVLIASAYPLLRGQDIREPAPTGTGAAAGAILRGEAGIAAPVWEYSVVSVAGNDREVEEALNAAAADGWELATATGTEGSLRCVLRRPKW